MAQGTECLHAHKKQKDKPTKLCGPSFFFFFNKTHGITRQAVEFKHLHRTETCQSQLILEDTGRGEKKKKKKIPTEKYTGTIS